MAWPLKLLLAVFLILAAAIGPTHGDAMVTGTVLCDQCKDGHVSLFDYPVLGIKVSLACPGSDGQMVTLKEETTNWLGNYDMRIEGTPELRGCYAQISGSGQGSMGCGAAAGPVQKLRLMFSMFDMEFYTVDPLLSQPAKPMPFCPSSPGNTVPAPATPPPVRVPPVPVTPPPVRVPPVPVTPPPVRVPPVPVTPPPVRVPPVPATGPPFRFPPAPRLPPLPPLPPMPPMPFLEASACPHQMWTMPQYHCYWRVLRPDTKVAIVFGPMAARRYGTNITLIGSMGGRGDPYKTLLREGTTALLNSYNSLQFPYNPLGVVQHMNWALMGSTRQVLHTALHFMKANSGNGNMACRFNSCK